MTNAVVLIAVGDKKWGEMSLNMCLSIKANDPKQKVALIYTEGTIKGIEPLIDKYFDYGLNVFNHFESPIEFAFYLKTRLYDYATEMMPNIDCFIYLDSDCIMIPGQSVNQWFNKHEGLEFTSYCNDVYDYTTKTRKRKDYTFWCNPDELLEQLPYLKKIPQTNSSFLYFKKCENAKELFDRAKAVWDDTEIKYQDYKGVKPDELCFNIACAITGLLPHQTHYRPIFFTFASETKNSEYILHYYKAFGFAGIHKPIKWLVSMYNSMSRYYREHFSIVKNFELPLEYNGVIDTNPIDIKIASKRTLFRKDELSNSEGGIFNPDGILLEDGSLMTIYRKEPNRDIIGGYMSNSSIPHIHILRTNSEEDFEVLMSDKPSHVRFEDFRFFEWDDSICVSHHRIVGNLKDGMTCEPVISSLIGNELKYTDKINLPIATNKIEKNWVYIGENGDLFTIYSLNPYRIFKGVKSPVELSVKQPNINWFHKSFISNSTNPILIGDSYLMFFHTKESGIYHHGACLIDKATKEITHYTRNSYSIKKWGHGFQPNLIYVSGSVYLPKRNLIRVFFGEADESSCYNDYGATEFINILKLYPVEEVNNENAINRLNQIK